MLQHKSAQPSLTVINHRVAGRELQKWQPDDGADSSSFMMNDDGLGWDQFGVNKTKFGGWCVGGMALAPGHPCNLASAKLRVGMLQYALEHSVNCEPKPSRSVCCSTHSLDATASTKPAWLG